MQFKFKLFLLECFKLFLAFSHPLRLCYRFFRFYFFKFFKKIFFYVLFFFKIYTRKFLAFFHLHGYRISNAFIAGSTILLSLKLTYYIIYNEHIPLKFNMLLWITCILLALYYKIHFYIRYMTYKAIRIALGERFFVLGQSTWKRAKQKILNGENLRYPCPKFQHPFEGTYSIKYVPQFYEIYTFIRYIIIGLI